MRKSRVLRLLIAFIIISLVCAGFLSYKMTNNKLSYVVDSLSAPDGSVYVIDDNGKNITLMKINEQGEYLSGITLSKTYNGISRELDKLSLDKDGTVYVYQKEKDISSNKILSENIYSCNFNEKKTVLEWKLPVMDEEDQNYFSPRVTNSTLYYFAVKYNAKALKAQAVLYKAGKDENPQEISTTEYDIGIGFTDLYYAENGDVVFSTPEGDLFRKPSTGANERLYPDKNGTLTTKIANFSPDGENKVYFADTKKGEVVCLDLKTGDAVTVGKIQEYLDKNQSLKYFDLKKVRYTPQGKFTASIYRSDNSNALLISDNNQNIIVSNIKVPYVKYLRDAGIYFCMVFGALLAVKLLIWLYMLITGAKVPIIVKQILVFIPIVVISMLVMQHLINTRFTNELVDSQYKELFLVSRQKTEAISPKLVSEINIDRPYKNVYYYNLRQIVTALPSSAEVYDSKNLNSEPVKVNNFSYYWLYKVQDGKLVTLFCDQNYVNIPIEYMFNQNTVDLFNTALKDKKTVRGVIKDIGGDWIILITPITDEKGNVVALMETGTTKASLELKVSENTKQISKINLITLTAMILFLLIMLFISLYPLKKLKRGVQAITDGDLGVQVKVTGKDEITDIAKVFNKMSLHISNHVGELTALNEGYYKFVPYKMFEMLRKTSVTDVRLGDQTKAEITILTFNAVGFDEMVSTMTADEMFKLINNIFSNLVPIVINNGGVVDRFFNAGLVAFFTEGSECALNAAISLCQRMDIINAQGTMKNHVDMTMAISHGPVMIGIVGHEHRLSATTISEHSNLTGFLRGIAPKYSSKILTTGSAISKIPDFKSKYNARLIGFLYIRNEDTVEKLYDVFDGDTADMKLMKKQTRELFEKGVSLYCAKEFYEARLVFIEVLKQFREDSAAKEYLYLCDNYYQKDTKDIEVYIEKF